MKFSKHKLFFVGYVALIVAGFFSWYLHRTLTSSRAAADNVAVTFSPKAGSYPKAVQQDVDILIQSADGSKKISGLDLTLNATGPIKFTNITDPVPFPGTDTTLFNQVLRNVTDNQIRISYVSLKSDPELPSVVKIRVSFQGTANGTGTISIDQAKTQIVGNVSEKVYGIGSADTGTYNISDTTSVQSVSVRIDPPSFEVPLPSTDDYIVAVAITDVPVGSKISAYNFVLQYNPALIDVTSIDAPIDAATGADSSKFTMLKKTIDSATGKIELAYVVSLPDAELPARPKQFIHIRSKKAGTGALTFVSTEVTGNIPSSTYMVNPFGGSYTVVDLNPSVTVVPTQPSGSCYSDADCADNQLCSTNLCIDLPCRAVYIACIRTVPRNHTCAIEYAPNGTSCENGGICQNGTCSQTGVTPTSVVTTSPVPTQTPVPTTTVPAGNISLTMKIKLQGILKKPVATATTMKVKVSIDGNQANDVQSQLVDFTSDDFGIWSGTTAFNAPAGGGYKVFIKAAQHLQKRICDAQPTESASGTYRCGDLGKITLQNGNNTLDFSNIIQLSGDLPDQDGVVDAYDISYLRLNLGSTDPKVLSTGDINRDGLVDTQDYALLVASLNVKYDEL